MGKTKHTEQKQYFSITEAAEFLGVSRPTIYTRLNSRELPYNQVSSRTIRIQAKGRIMKEIKMDRESLFSLSNNKAWIQN